MTNRAREFLARMDAATRDGRMLDVIVADPGAFIAAVEDHPDRIGQVMDRAANHGGGTVTVPAAAFASAACRRDGRVIAADSSFSAFGFPQSAIQALVKSAELGVARLSSILDDTEGGLAAVAVAAADRAQSWPLDPTVRRALEADPTSFGLLCAKSPAGIDFAHLFSSWDLSAAEQRLTRTLIQHGDLRRAAKSAGVAYETARDTLASAMAKVGARRQPDFVRELTQMVFGEMPTSDNAWRTFADAYGLTARQGRLSLLVASGATRAAAAVAIGVSEHTAKAELKVIYEQCGLDGGVALGRIVAETCATARLAAATDVNILGSSASPTPLRFFRRRRGPGRIAVEDHGPRGGEPVVVFHTPTSGRRLPHVLVASMHAQGLRPISVERPGFGLTSAAEGDVTGQANADLIDILDALDLARVRILGRSVSMPLHFAAAHGDRVVGGVLLSPSPPGMRVVHGVLGALSNFALDHPSLVEGFARMVARISSEPAIMRATHRALADSPADLSALADARNRDDWVRGARQSSMGDGFAREFALHADGGTVPAAALDSEWTVLIGAQDSLGIGLGDVVAAWAAAAPRVRVEMVPGAGRLVHISHPVVVARALRAL